MYFNKEKTYQLKKKIVMKDGTTFNKGDIVTKFFPSKKRRNFYVVIVDGKGIQIRALSKYVGEKRSRITARERAKLESDVLVALRRAGPGDHYLKDIIHVMGLNIHHSSDEKKIKQVSAALVRLAKAKKIFAYVKKRV